MIKVRKLTVPILPFFQLFPIINCRDAAGVPQPCSLPDAENLLVRILQFMWAFSGAVAVLVIFWSAFQYITAAGDPAKAESARKTLFAGVVGAIIVVAGYAATMIFANTIAGTDVPIPPGLNPNP